MSRKREEPLITHHLSVITIEGVLRDGLRVAAQFTELPWVRKQFQRKLGLDVWPGTVNLQVQDPAGLAVMARLRLAPEAPGGIASGVPIEPPRAPGMTAIPSADAPASEQPTYCVGYCFPAFIGDLPAAIVIPHVPDYPADKLELVAAVRVRDALGVQPGDRLVVTVVVEDGPTLPAQRRSQYSASHPVGKGEDDERGDMPVTEGSTS